MINKLVTLFHIRKSIRGAILWRFVLSLLLTVLIMILFNHIKNYYPIAPYLAVFDIFIFAGLFTALFFYFTRPIVQYVMKLAEGLHVISRGDLTYRVPAEREDELGRVADSINAMAEALMLQQANERQQEQAKMALITGISHDLRTPLTSIIGYLDLLTSKSYQDTEEQERFIHNTYKKAIHLKYLIDDLFEYTRLISTDVKLQKEQIDLRELLEQMLVEFEPIAHEYGVRMHWRLGAAPALVQVDSEKIIRALDNLLLNALKFSIKPGDIHVSFQSGNGRLSVAIENEGKPITAEQEKHLFERFYKADDSRTANEIQSGSGLGLSIAKNIVELHGGTISLRHEHGHFTFTVRLPEK